VPLAVCATPIGNLADVTLRVLEELREADAILCEDTRRTRILLDRHGIRARRLVSLHRHNEVRRTDELLPLLVAGARHALVSDAGLPGVNDPGGRLVRAALDEGVEVTVLPGASAVETALVASALGGAAGYRFLGYLPRRDGELDTLWAESRSWPYAAVAFESPQRLRRSLERLARADPERRVAVCRELTKRFEEVARGTAAELSARFAGPTRGEVTVVLAPGAAGDADADEDAAAAAAAAAAVRRLVEAGAARRVAADVVSGLVGTPRNELYRASLDRAD
jgi:16S rRNA (cytidine1402-2'-O)-methyltransferase